MIDSAEILDTLDDLIDRYNSGTATPKEQYFCAKIAVIEVCGWIEECMDRMVLDLSDNHIRRQANKKIVQRRVDHTHGFTYPRHFRPLLTWVIGGVSVEQLEARLDQRVFQLMQSELNSLARVRNQLAHSSFNPYRPSLDSPSFVRVRFDRICEGLGDVESTLALLVG